MARHAVGEFDEAQIAGPVAAEIFYQTGLKYALGAAGMARDNVEAHKWFNIAAQQGCNRARAEREMIAGEMSRDQIAEAQRAAREWFARTH